MIDPTAAPGAGLSGYPPGLAEAGLRVLLVEDNDADAFIVEAMLRRVKGLTVELERVARLDEAMARLSREGVDVVLLDLSLPDSDDRHTFPALHAATNRVPVIVLSALADEEASLTAVRQGAQDYLVKGTVTPESLARAIRYGLERHRLLAALRSLSLLDELTGLYNRRGFLTLASGHLTLARRNGRRAVLLFGDLDGLKAINDTWGHEEGDVAIRATADVLRATFRQSDLLARFGGDEFVVLALDVQDGRDDELLARLARQFARWNEGSDRPWALALAAGIVEVGEATVEALDEALRDADREQYARKRERRARDRRIA
ncbi:MAG: diguanylate cyclase [Gemmatimonadales bacterium]|nr:diguanylate cyclase [Gemmatimonadales bacterium]